MPLPTFYTDATLAAFMRDVIKSFVDDLGWTTDTPYVEPTNEVLLACNATDLSQVADIAKVRALARIAIWKAVEEATAGDFDTRSASGEEDKRSQIHVQATKQRIAAQAALKTLLDERVVAVEEAPLPNSQSVPVVAVW